MNRVLATTKEREEQNERLSSAFEGEKRRLLASIRQRIPSEIDAEDLLQEVFSELDGLLICRGKGPRPEGGAPQEAGEAS